MPAPVTDIPTKLKDSILRAVRTYKQHFKRLFLPLLVFQVILLLPFLFMALPGTVSLLRDVLEFLNETGGSIRGILYLVISLVAVALFLSPLIIGGAVYVIDRDFEGKPVHFKEAFRFGRKSYWPMLKSYLCAIVLVIPIVLVVIVIFRQMFSHGFDLVFLKPVDIFILIVIAVGILLFFMGTIFVPYTVVSEKKGGFAAVSASFKYVYKGSFLSNLSRLLLMGIVLVVAVLVVKWITTLPFQELFELYLVDPASALRQPLMIAAIMVVILGLFVVAFVLPFWYAFSYNTYKGAKMKYEQKCSEKAGRKGNGFPNK